MPNPNRSVDNVIEDYLHWAKKNGVDTIHVYRGDRRRINRKFYNLVEDTTIIEVNEKRRKVYGEL